MRGRVSSRVLIVLVLACGAALPDRGARAQPAIAIAADYKADASFLSPAPDGATSLLLLSRPVSPDTAKPSALPPRLELLSFDAAGSATRRVQVDRAVADAMAADGPSRCQQFATAAKDGGFVVITSKGYEKTPLAVLATVFVLAPDGGVRRTIDIGHPAFATDEFRKRWDVGLCVRIASPGPDGSLLLTGSYVASLGIGDEHPWWAVFDAGGREIAQAGREDEAGDIIAARRGEDGKLSTVRQVHHDSQRVGRLSTDLSLRLQPRTGAPPRTIVLEKNEFLSRAVFTAGELAVVSISNRWTKECSFTIGFYSLDGRRLRSRPYLGAVRPPACDAPPGDGMPDGLKADGEGFLAEIEQSYDGSAPVLARFDREGRVAWRSPHVRYPAVARRANGALVAIEETPAGLLLRDLP
ncbi:MAG TPA: hypothetical protein VMI56_22695 [Reyranella sp.]|nr:hypothetical protein [Reyranella sp.]